MSAVLGGASVRVPLRGSARVHRISCPGCGWWTGVGGLVGDVRPEPDSIARVAAQHLTGCPKRFKAHPAFGYTARWTSQTTYPDGVASEEIIVWWGPDVRESWAGMPFDIDAALADEMAAAREMVEGGS